MSTYKLEIPGTEVFVSGKKLGVKTGATHEFINEPDWVTISDLRGAMVSRGWLIDDHDVYDPVTKSLKRKIKRDTYSLTEEDLIPIYNELTSSSNFIKIGDRLCSIYDITNQDDSERYMSELGELVKIFNKYIMVKEDNIGEYNRLVSARDILSKTSEVCLLCPMDGSYTNIVNINSIQGNPVQLRVGIAYSKDDEMYSKDVILSKIDDSYIKSESLDFTLEYTDGCLRVFPESQEVTECVISYCYLTYECLI